MGKMHGRVRAIFSFFNSVHIAGKQKDNTESNKM